MATHPARPLRGGALSLLSLAIFALLGLGACTPAPAAEAPDVDSLGLYCRQGNQLVNCPDRFRSAN